ncbi:DUF2059 domain-containing protein [uncultured Tateyamaria sp.]|uniref:DUF2059 domain-containing protein n=1 Tax=uncultured Tateyamaria sp. TaxID=455651 RepID=UPI0026193956|nr:DUF2059 domain-containing protein [uncultured Tateyamaria sp.]
MPLRTAIAALCLSASAALANPDVDRLIEAMGVPALIAAFSEDGIEAGGAINDTMLQGQGGTVWVETVRKLYDPARLLAELQDAMAATLDESTTAQALLFFESDIGTKIIDLEVQARQAMQNPDVEAAARAAGAEAGPVVTQFLDLRDLVTRNTDAAVMAQTAFFAGIAETSLNNTAPPDVEAQRPAIMEDTSAWLYGYYALIQSPMTEDEIETYAGFWATDVGQALDNALFDAFAQSYATLSYGLGQAAGALMPENEL